VSGGSIYLVRHARTGWNHESRMQGHTDVPLDEVGRRQAALLVGRFRAVEMAAIYTSDLLRAAETAAIIAEATGLEPRPSPQLREAFFGDWEGLTRDDLERDYAEEYAAYQLDPVAVRPPGAEGLAAMIDRAVAEFGRIAAKHPGQTVLIVTHGGPVRGLGMRLLAGTNETFRRLRSDNTGVSLVQQETDGRWMIALWNDTAHLAAAPSEEGK
jgi:broad specificity phosphatase PhoE